MNYLKILTFLSIVPFLVSCSKEMTREDALKRIETYDINEAKAKYGNSLNVHKVTEVKKATGVFAEGGELYDNVKNYKSEEKDVTASLSGYFVTSSKISAYNSTSYKYLKVSFKASGSKGLVINVSSSDTSDKSGIKSKMKQTIYDNINDDGILLEETTYLYYSWSGAKEGEFEYSTSTKVVLLSEDN